MDPRQFIKLVVPGIACVLILTACSTKSRSMSIQGPDEIQRHRFFLYQQNHRQGQGGYLPTSTDGGESNAHGTDGTTDSPNEEPDRASVTPPQLNNDFKKKFWVFCVILAGLQAATGGVLLTANAVARFKKHKWRARWQVIVGMIACGLACFGVMWGMRHPMVLSAVLGVSLLSAWGFMSWWAHVSSSEFTHFYATRGVLARASNGLRDVLAETGVEPQKQALDRWIKSNYTVLTAHTSCIQFNRAFTALREIETRIRESDAPLKLSELAEWWKPIDVALELEYRDRAMMDDGPPVDLTYRKPRRPFTDVRDRVVEAFKELQGHHEKKKKANSFTQWESTHSELLDAQNGWPTIDQLILKFRGSGGLMHITEKAARKQALDDIKSDLDKLETLTSDPLVATAEPPSSDTPGSAAA